jgi:hypothetical protein
MSRRRIAEARRSVRDAWRDASDELVRESFPMGATDHAILVGVNRYPGLTPNNLQGAERDALAFFAWVTHPNGGDVPVENVQFIQSQLIPERLSLRAVPSSSPVQSPALGFTAPLARAENALPSSWQVEIEFDKLETIATENATASDTKSPPRRQVGRRLYLYFAGHGVGDSFRAAGLLAANATPVRVGHHIPATAWARLFLEDGYFQEVCLFMDCCREHLLERMKEPGWRRQAAPAADPPRSLFAFATAHEGRARERPYPTPDGVWRARGAFTMALIEGLEGAACERNGDVTAGSLADFMEQRLPHYLAGTHSTAVALPQFVLDEHTPAFVLVRVDPVPRYPVALPVPRSALGQEVRVFDDKGGLYVAVPAGEPNLSTAVPAGEPELRLSLPRGLWRAAASGGGWERHVQVNPWAVDLLPFDSTRVPRVVTIPWSWVGQELRVYDSKHNLAQTVTAVYPSLLLLLPPPGLFRLLGPGNWETVIEVH